MTKVVDSLSKISTYSNEFEIKQTNKTLLEKCKKKSQDKVAQKKTFAWLKKAQKNFFSQQRASVS